MQTPATLISATVSARAIFNILWLNEDAEIVNAIFGRTSPELPRRVVLPHTILGTLRKRFGSIMHRAGCRWGVCASLISRRQVLSKDAPHDGPLLLSLTKLGLFKAPPWGISDDDGYRLLDMLIVRVEQGVPLQTVDLRACLMTTRIVQLLSEIVVDVQGYEHQFSMGTRWRPVFCFQRGVGGNDDDAYGDESDDSESISDDEDEEDENEGGDFDVDSVYSQMIIINAWEDGPVCHTHTSFLKSKRHMYCSR